MFIHGFKESGKRGSAAVIANAYATRDDHNLIILDWENEASGDYFINGVPNSVTVSAKQVISKDINFVCITFNSI